MRKTPLYKRRTIIAFFLLTGVLLFNVFGYYYIDNKTYENHQREDGQKLLASQETRTEEIAQTIIILGIHNTSFSKEQSEKQLKDLNSALETFKTENVKLSEIISKNAWHNGSVIHQLFSNSDRPYRHLTTQAKAVIADTAKMYANNYTFSGEVRKTAAALQKSLRGISGAFYEEEARLEKEIDIMNKALIVSLIFVLLFIGIIVTAPSLKRNMESYQELQKTLEEVKKSESLLRKIIDSSPDLIFVLDKALKYKMVNKAFAEFSGLSQEKLIDKSDEALGLVQELSGEEIENGKSWAASNAEVITTAKSRHIPEETLIVNGKIIMVSMTRLPLHDSDGSVWGMLGFAQDITERIEWEQKIKASEKQYRYLFESNPMPMWIFDSETCMFLRVNKMTIRHYGYTEEEFAAMSIFDIRPGDEVQKLKAELSPEIDNTKSFVHGQWTHIKKNGEKIVMEIFSHEINYGNKKAMLVLAKDVTDSIHLQNALIEERISRQRDIAQATINVQEKERNEIGKELHDNVNQILTSAKLHLEYMDNDAAQKEKHHNTSIRLISTAINEIRRLSKSLVPPTIKDVGLVSSVQELTDSNNLLSAVHFNFMHDEIDEDTLSESLKLTVFRIIQEQTTNILKYAEASSATIEIRLGKTQLLLSIRDNGKGFDTTQQSKGVGMLNIINRADIYGGTVTIQSAPGKGCSLGVDFDLNKLKQRTRTSFL